MSQATVDQKNEQTITSDQFYETFHKIRTEISNVVVGQEEVIEHLLIALFAGGHMLLRGLPGLGRTLIVQALAETLGLDYRRLQFTPDLLPSDIIGAEVLEHNRITGDRSFRFFKGPVFANMVLVDEINRSPTRTQSALLEVMQEKQVTAGGATYRLPKPFTLIATENTLDTEGVWPLGEAQVDRFMVSIQQDYPTSEDERKIIYFTTGTDTQSVQAVTSAEEVLAMQALVREVPVVPSVKDFALNIVRASRPGELDAAETTETNVRLGASPRAAQALMLGAKVTALARGRKHVTQADIINVVKPVMRHRVLMDVRAEAEGVTCEEIIEDLVNAARLRSLPKVSRSTRDVLKSLIAR